MITIPFSSRLGASSGVALDGVVYGTLPKVAPVSALSEAHLSQFIKVYRGNADASGGVNWTDVTTAANNDTAGDVSLFDTTNPTGDLFCAELSVGDEINGISLLISTAAALSGTPVAEVRYRTASGWATATGIVTPLLTSTGLKTVTFAKIKYSDIALTDSVINPFNAAQQRCLYLRFTGITAVTTVPAFTRVWKKYSHDSARKSTNYTAAVAQGANPDFSTLQSAILPATDDLSLIGFDAPIVRLHPTIYRPTAAGLGAREWVYSKADGTFVALPAANISDPSNMFGSALSLNPIAHQRINLTSTYAAGTWGNSGIASTETLIGDGYVEFRVGASPSLAMMIGFSEANANANYTSIGWAIHAGHGATAFASWWRNGVQQSGGTTAIVTGDVMRLERVGATISAYKNGVLLHTFAVTTTAPLLVDTAFIFLAAATDLVLVNKVLSLDVPINITWSGNVAVTVANGGTQQFGIATTHQININPPADWGKISLTDTADVVRNLYWLGWRYTADTPNPVLPDNFTVRGQPVQGAGVTGIPGPEAGTYTSLTVVCRETSAVEEKLLLINSTTGKVASVTVPANTAVATASVSLVATKGDNIVMVHVAGSNSGAIGDGAVFLS